MGLYSYGVVNVWIVHSEPEIVSSEGENKRTSTHLGRVIVFSLSLSLSFKDHLASDASGVPLARMGVRF